MDQAQSPGAARWQTPQLLQPALDDCTRVVAAPGSDGKEATPVQARCGYEPLNRHLFQYRQYQRHPANPVPGRACRAHRPQ